MGKKSDLVRLGLYGLVSVGASMALILPAACAAGYGWALHRFLGQTGLAGALWAFAAILFVESFNCFGTWKRGKSRTVRFMAACTFFIARISGIAFFALLFIWGAWKGDYGMAAVSLLLHAVSLYSFGQRLAEQSRIDEFEEGERLRAFVDPEQFKRQAEWQKKLHE